MRNLILNIEAQLMFYPLNFIHLQRHMCLADIIASDQRERPLCSHDRGVKRQFTALRRRRIP